MDLALNNLQGLICYKTQTTNQPSLDGDGLPLCRDTVGVFYSPSRMSSICACVCVWMCVCACIYVFMCECVYVRALLIINSSYMNRSFNLRINFFLFIADFCPRLGRVFFVCVVSSSLRFGQISPLAKRIESLSLYGSR